tara:strand:- start:3746 stop:5509 length:1764 start_codon:yes stop_codon:yes gene_type:complete
MTIHAATTSELDFDIRTISYVPYDSGRDDEDIDEERERIYYQKKKLDRQARRRGERLFYDEQKKSAIDIGASLIDKGKRYITVVAPPGSGKTNLIHCLYHMFKANFPNEYIRKNITITTGMSDIDWQNQTEQGTLLRNTRREEEEKIFHRGQLKHRFDELKKHPELLSNHVFIVDECQIANQIDGTIDKEFRAAGLTSEMIEKFNIVLINISATPDSLLVEMVPSEKHALVELAVGKNYLSFQSLIARDFIEDYTSDEDLIRTLEEDIINYTSPRWHFIRIHNKKENIHNKVRQLEDKNVVQVIEHNSKERIDMLDEKLKAPPEKHTIIIIKDFYRASKRLRLTQHIGLVIEPPAKKADDTVTAQGLIARFLGYYSPSELQFPIGQTPKFIGNKDSIDRYIEFTRTWSYADIDYSSRRVNFNKGELTRFTSTHMACRAETMDKDTLLGMTKKTKYGMYPPQDSPLHFATREELIAAFEAEAAAGKLRVKKNDSGEIHFTKDHFHQTLSLGHRLPLTHADEPGGYWISSKINPYNINIRNTFTRSIILNSGACFDGSIQALIVPLYEHANSLPDSVQWVIKYIFPEDL